MYVTLQKEKRRVVLTGTFFDAKVGLTVVPVNNDVVWFERVNSFSLSTYVEVFEGN